jgi:uncharacterized RDD family membrane protein YckC
MASPAVTDPTAVVGRRVVAALIDGAVVIGPTVAIATANMEYITRERVGRQFDDYCDLYTDRYSGVCVEVGDRVYFSDTSANPGGLGFFVLSLLLLVVLQGLTGWTVGKLLTGLRTVKEDGSRPGIGKAFLRWILLLIDGLPCIPLVGFICALTSQGHRRVGDMAAKTFVVRARAAGQPILVPGLSVAPDAPARYETAPAGPGWAAPGTPPPGAPPPAPPPGQGPQWDPARGTYIQWDPMQSRWLQWDEATSTWSPIPGQ